MFPPCFSRQTLFRLPFYQGRIICPGSVQGTRSRRPYLASLTNRRAKAPFHTQDTSSTRTKELQGDLPAVLLIFSLHIEARLKEVKTDKREKYHSPTFDGERPREVSRAAEPFVDCRIRRAISAPKRIPCGRRARMFLDDERQPRGVSCIVRPPPFLSAKRLQEYRTERKSPESIYLFCPSRVVFLAAAACVVACICWLACTAFYPREISSLSGIFRV